MKKYLTGKNIALAALAIGCLFLLYLLFSGRREDPSLKILRQQQKQLDQMARENKKNAEEDRKRDSALKVSFEAGSKKREESLSTVKKQSNEKINRINRPDFTADSLRRAFAEN